MSSTWQVWPHYDNHFATKRRNDDDVDDGDDDDHGDDHLATQRDDLASLESSSKLVVGIATLWLDFEHVVLLPGDDDHNHDDVDQDDDGGDQSIMVSNQDGECWPHPSLLGTNESADSIQKLNFTIFKSHFSLIHTK